MQLVPSVPRQGDQEDDVAELVDRFADKGIRDVVIEVADEKRGAPILRV